MVLGMLASGLVVVQGYSVNWADTVKIMFLVACPKSACCLLGRQVPLRFCEHFKSKYSVSCWD